ncbi:MAG: hypothetical protein Q8936_12560 [Bacillota bacterium]|nr:hypothetical protein [Bacillota bacterium]
MNEQSLEIAKQDIDAALSTVEDMEKHLNENNLSSDMIKEQFLFLSQKVTEIEGILKQEGIL